MRKRFLTALAVSIFIANCVTVNQQLLPDYNGKKPTIKSAKIPSGVNDLLWYTEDKIYLYEDFRKKDEKATVYSLNVTTGKIEQLSGEAKKAALSQKRELKNLQKFQDSSNLAIRAAKSFVSDLKSTVTNSRYDDGKGAGKLSYLGGTPNVEFNYKLESKSEEKAGKSQMMYFYTLENDRFSVEIPCGTAEGWYTLNLWYLSKDGRKLIAGNNFCDLEKAKRPVALYGWYGWCAPSPEWDKLAIIKTNTFWIFTFKKLDITKLSVPL